MSIQQNEDAWFMGLALKQAEIALGLDEVPVGCGLVRDGQILCESHNLTNTLSDPLAHAEYVCVRRILDLGEGTENLIFYITIEPCAMCVGVLERINAKVIYGYENEIFGACRLLNKKSGTCLNDKRCIDILKTFYLTENKNTAHLRQSSNLL